MHTHLQPVIYQAGAGVQYSDTHRTTQEGVSWLGCCSHARRLIYSGKSPHDSPAVNFLFDKLLCCRKTRETSDFNLSYLLKSLQWWRLFNSRCTCNLGKQTKGFSLRLLCGKALVACLQLAPCFQSLSCSSNSRLALCLINIEASHSSLNPFQARGLKSSFCSSLWGFSTKEATWNISRSLQVVFRLYQMPTTLSSHLCDSYTPTFKPTVCSHVANEGVKLLGPVKTKAWKIRPSNPITVEGRAEIQIYLSGVRGAAWWRSSKHRCLAAGRFNLEPTRWPGPPRAEVACWTPICGFL